MIHVNSFLGGELIAAYTTNDNAIPQGVVLGRQGNAVLMNECGVYHVVSRPLIEGDITLVLPNAAEAPEIDLSRFF